MIISRTYTARKTAFEHEQLVEYFQRKKHFDEELREEMKRAWKDAGYLSDHPLHSDSGEDDDDEEVKDSSLNFSFLMNQFS